VIVLAQAALQAGIGNGIDILELLPDPLTPRRSTEARQTLAS
jgi:hypothetical protein